MGVLPVIGVFGSGRDGHEELALPLGRMLAELGCHLLTGGGGGVRESVARGFVAVRGRRGISIGILPGTVEGGRCRSPEGYPNRFVELPIRTHLPARGLEGEGAGSRNYLNVLSSRMVVVLPGGDGTAAEARIARRFGVPAIGWGGGAEDEGIAQAASLEEIGRLVRLCW
jgi:uncharacterized protein (TIGR00725 family)